MVFVIFAVTIVTGCGGGSNDLGTSFNVKVIDSGCGFDAAGQTNFVLLNADDYTLESARAIRSSEKVSDSRAEFQCSLGKPRVDSTGVGVFEVRITQGAANTWRSSDEYDRWTVNDDTYVLGWGPPDSRYPGYSVWNLNTTAHVSALDGYHMVIETYFLPKYRVGTSSVGAKLKSPAAIDPARVAKVIALY